ncbi:MAG: FHA domain-containing protein [Bifidobacteriaceae bacterium]|jgi:S-DNA-T family DNA segregation ATPase FtsK/SpoIIIE|nr:FHA domain-containing protein [Bifidobacteriaceae bacterium]
MHLKLTLVRSEGRHANVRVTADPTATVGDVAAALFSNDPERAGQSGAGQLTVRARQSMTGQTAILPPDSQLQDVSLRSGAIVDLVTETAAYTAAAAARGPAAALVRVLSGPDAGREFQLPVGTSYLGRAADSDVLLTDRMVSGRHARIVVGAVVEVVDLNSANGIILGGQHVTRVVAGPTDQILLGDTVISITPLRQASDLVALGPVVEFNRSPRVVARFEERKIATPKPPSKARPVRFPYLAMAAPLIMGVVMYLFTKSIMSVVFVALSPILMIGTYVDQLITGRREFKAALKQFNEAAAATDEKIDRLHALERSVRLSRAPSVAECTQACAGLGPLMWTHRPESLDFLAVRLGIGSSPSLCEMELPAQNETTPECWTRLEELAAKCALLEHAPIIANLRECGSIGVAGPIAAADSVARGLVWQLAALHSPAEVAFAAIMSRRARQAWDWLEWLPHTSSPHSPLPGDLLATGPAAGASLLARLEELIEQRAAGRSSSERFPALRGPLDPKALPEIEPTVPAVLLVVSDDAPVDRGRLNRVAERGPDVGVHLVWVAGRPEALPAACRTFIVVGDDLDQGTSGQVRLGLLDFPLLCERFADADAMALARQVAPVVDTGAPVEDDSDLPRALSYLNLAGMELAQSESAIIERWRQTLSINAREDAAVQARRKAGGLRALVGQSAEGSFSLDLRTQGPHALVGGTTGAGKSEFLQAWVMGLATAYSPDRVTFLFVDYKGGSAFADCVKLPHCVGLVTDLSPHLVRRALTSLRAELRYREHLLNRKKAKDLLELERSGDPTCPPSLLIIVDEFAALVQEVPEFVDGVIDVAQRGRSLGLHLILATQRPAGVIKDNLRANTNLRIALRMADESDSQDVLGLTMAAHFDPSIPGRAAAKTGPGRVTPFQTGYVGGWTTGEVERAPVVIDELDFGTAGTWEAPEDPAAEVTADPGPNDIARVVEVVGTAAESAAIPNPRKPWLEPLAPMYELARFSEYRDDEHLLLGVMDDPDHQSQPVVYYEPDKDGNLAIIGSGGSGKSTALRTIALSAVASTRHGGPVFVYGLDFGAGGLRMLEDLPHVGAIISGDDEERVMRLLRTLRAIVDRRSIEFGRVDASTVVDYRKLAGKPDEPRIILLIDGMTAFREAYEYTGLSAWFTTFAQIAADGRPLGVHVVMTGDRPNAIPPSISSTIQRRIVLRMASEDDYLMLNEPKDVLDASSPPGRALLDANELQFAVLGGDSNVAVQGRAIRGLAAAARRRGPAVAPPVARLTDQVALNDLPALDSAGRPVIGLEDESLGPVGFDPSGAFAVSGPPGAGRTTALATLALALRRAAPSTKLILFAPRRSPLEAVLTWDSVARGDDQATAMADELVSALDVDGTQPRACAIFIESLADFTNSMAEMSLETLVKVAARTEQLVVGETESSTWSQAYTLSKPFKAGRRGLLLIPSDMEGDSLLSVQLPRIRTVDFPPGRGFLVTGGTPRKVQVAMT